MRLTGGGVVWLSTGVACLALGSTNPAGAQEENLPDPGSKVENLTEVEDVPAEAQRAPRKTQVLPPQQNRGADKSRRPEAQDRPGARQRGDANERQRPDARQRQRPDATGPKPGAQRQPRPNAAKQPRPDTRRQPPPPAQRSGTAEDRRTPPRRGAPDPTRQSAQDRQNIQIAPRQLGLELGARQGRRLSVQNVNPNSAAARIGLRSGDEVVSLGGRQIASQQEFNAALDGQLRTRRLGRNFQIPVVVRRNGRLQTYYWTNVALALAGYGPLLNRYGYYVPPRYIAGYRGSVGAPDAANDPGGAYLGIELDTRYPDAAIVARVVEGTPADQAGLQPGDRIWALNNQRVESLNELINWISRMQPGQQVEISFDRPYSVQVVLTSRGQGVVTGTDVGAASETPALPAEPPGPNDADPVPVTETPQPSEIPHEESVPDDQPPATPTDDKPIEP